MAAPDDVSVKGSTRPDAEVDELRQQVNNLVASVRLICEMIDADNGTIGTDYVSSVTDSGVTTAPAKVTRVYG